MTRPPIKLILARPRGFCAGVERAIDVVDEALRVFSAPVYVYHEIVHNAHVVRDLRGKGAVFVDDLDDVPDGAVVVFSAHGVSPEIRKGATARSLRIIDATCPLVTKVHLEARRFARKGRTIFLVGHMGHDEVIGTMGEAPDRIVLLETLEDAESVEVDDPGNVALITQTTLSLDETRDIVETIRRRFPAVQMPRKDDICYATQNRQVAVKRIAERADLVLVIGSENSSNSTRLAEISRATGSKAELIDDVSEIDPEWLKDVEVVGITAGASAPENLVEEVIGFFRSIGVDDVETVEVVREAVHFELPLELTREVAARAGSLQREPSR